MNKKERRLAYSTAFQSAAENVVVVEDLKVSPTSPFAAVLNTALPRPTLQVSYLAGLHLSLSAEMPTRGSSM